MRNIDLIIRQLKGYKKFTKDKELAMFLGINPSTIASWRNRNMINLEIILQAMPEINPEWLRTGEGAMMVEQQPKISQKDTAVLVAIIDRLTKTNEEQSHTIARLTELVGRKG